MISHYNILIFLTFAIASAKPRGFESSTLVSVSQSLDTDQNTDQTPENSDYSTQNSDRNLLAEIGTSLDDSALSVATSLNDSADNIPASPDASAPKMETPTTIENGLPNNLLAKAAASDSVEFEGINTPLSSSAASYTVAQLGESIFNVDAWWAKGVQLFVGKELSVLKAEVNLLVSGAAYIQGTIIYFSCGPKPKTLYKDGQKQLVTVEVLEEIIKKIKCPEPNEPPSKVACKLLDESLRRFAKVGKFIPEVANVVPIWKTNGEFNSMITKIGKILCYCCKELVEEEVIVDDDAVIRTGGNYQINGKKCTTMLYTQTNLAVTRDKRRLR